jgi:hypothetical protein
MKLMEEKLCKNVIFNQIVGFFKNSSCRSGTMKYISNHAELDREPGYVDSQIKISIDLLRVASSKFRYQIMNDFIFKNSISKVYDNFQIKLYILSGRYDMTNKESVFSQKKIQTWREMGFYFDFFLKLLFQIGFDIKRISYDVWAGTNLLIARRI